MCEWEEHEFTEEMGGRGGEEELAVQRTALRNCTQTCKLFLGWAARRYRYE